MRYGKSLVLLAAGTLLSASGCGGGEETSIRIDGSSTVLPISEAVAEDFRADHPDVRVTVGFSGTGGGMKKFAAGEIDICDASRPMKPSEKEACRENGVKYLELKVALDGLAVVVHPENDWCNSLTLAQLKELWRPESAVKRWSDLNPRWPNREIKLHGPGHDSGTFDFFTKTVVGEEKASRADYNPSEDDNVLVRGVQADRYALAYFGYAYYTENKSKLKLVGIDAGGGPVEPSVETVLDESYALARPLLIYVRESSLERSEVVDFIKFYLDKAAGLAKEVGYIPLPGRTAAENRQALDQALKRIAQ